MPAHEIEQFVIDTLASADTHQPIKRLGPKRRAAYREFAEFWSKLTFVRQLRLLRSAVDRVTFEPTTTTIQVSFNEAEMMRLKLKESGSRTEE